MIMNMNEKGRQTKLLAAIAVLAMVVCALAVVMPSDDVSGVPTAPTSFDGEIENEAALYATTAGNDYRIDSAIQITSTSEEVVINGNLWIVGNGTLTLATSATAKVTVNGNIYIMNGGSFIDDKEWFGVTPGTNAKITVVQGGTLTVTDTDENEDVTLVGTNGFFTPSATGWIVVGVADNGTTYSVNGAVSTAAGNVYESDSMTVEAGATLTVSATEVEGDRNLNITGALVNKGTIVVSENALMRVFGGQSSVDNQGTITNNGDLIVSWNYDQENESAVLFTNNGTITNNSVITLNNVDGSETQEGSIINAEGGTITNNGIINGSNTLITGEGVLKAVYSGSVYYSNITAALANASSSILVYGDYSTGTNNVTLDADNHKLYLAPGAEYTGTITFGTTEAGEEQNYVSVTINAVNTGSDNVAIAQVVDKVLTINGNPEAIESEDGNLMTGSDVTVRGITSGYASTEDLTVTDRNTVTLSGVELSSMTLRTAVTVGDKDLVIPQGTTITFVTGSSITPGANDLYIIGDLRVDGVTETAAKSLISVPTGTIYASDVGEVSKFTTTSVWTTGEKTGKIVAIDSYTISIGSTNYPTSQDVIDALKQLPDGTDVTLTAESDTATLDITGELNLDRLNISIPADKTITINVGTNTTDASVVLNNVTIDANSGNSIINVTAGSILNGTQATLYIMVNEMKDSTVEITNNVVTYDNTTSNVKVGYKTTLILSGSGSNVVDVYGDLVIRTNATVSAGTTMNVYTGGSVTIDTQGSLTVLGTAYFMDGSEGTVNGTVTVGATNQGGASLIVEDDFTVAEGATVSIMNAGRGNLNYNVLDAGEPTYTSREGYTGGFEVLGTLSMNGAMSGVVLDKGTVTFNGIANADAGIILFNGVSITLGTVINTLLISDAGIADELLISANNDASTGNVIAVSNVNGLTISEELETINWSDAAGTNYRDYRAVMPISGTLATQLTEGAYIAVSYVDTPFGVGSSDDYQYAHVTIPADVSMTFGKDVSFQVNAPVVIDGTVNFIRADAANDEDTKTIYGDGEITVNGTVTVTQGKMLATDINATMYANTVTNAATGQQVTTETYTNFVAAITAAPEADDDTVTVMGTVNATSIDVPAGVIINLDIEAVLVVLSGETVELADGASLLGDATTLVTVEGTLISNDYLNDIATTVTIEADAILTEGAVRTWTSLANAIELGWETITLNRPIIIDEDLTIPAGITVSTNVAPGTETVGGQGYTFSILVYGATLTVEGSLQMGSVAAGAFVVADSATSEGEVAVPGNMQVTVSGSATVTTDVTGIDGAHFVTASGAYRTHHVGSIAYAAQTASNNVAVTEDGVWTIGVLAGNDVSFTAPEDGNLKVTINAGTTEAPSVLTVGTMTIGTGVQFVISGDFNGVLSAPVADGTSNTSLDMSGVSGVTVVAGSTIGATATTYFVGMTGTLEGDVIVTQGTLTVGTANTAGSNGMTVGAEATIVIDSGAELDIPDNRTLTIAEYDNPKGIIPVTVAGTMTVSGNIVVSGDADTMEVYVSGTMNVNENLTVSGYTLRVSGSLVIASDADMTVANGTNVILGDKPENLGETTAASMAGSVEIAIGGKILAYNGADVSGAQIDWNDAMDRSDAQSTVYYINEQLYATIYVDAADRISIVSDINTIDEPIQLSGYQTAQNWYATQDDAETALASGDTTGNINPDRISETDVAYAQVNNSTVKGTISKDAGIILTIDGLIVDDGYGGDVSQTITDKPLSVGTHVIAWSERTGYNIENVTVTFNGVAVENGGTIIITADMTSYTIIADGAVPGAAPGGDTGSTGGDDGMGLTDYLLIVLVVLIVVMAIIVAIRLMRS